jgi:hypothetical protein
LSNELEKANAVASKHADMLSEARKLYDEAEKYNQSATAELKNNLYGKSGSSGGSSASGGNGGGGGGAYGDKENLIDVAKQIDSMLEWIIKWSSDSSNFGFFCPPNSSNWDNFTMKYMGKTFAQLLENYAKLNPYIFGQTLAAGALGAGYEIAEFYEDYKSGIKSKTAFLLDMVNTGISAVSEWTEAVLNIDDILKGKLPKYDGNWKTFCEWAPVINVPFKFATTYAESYAEYSADGEFSRTDFASALVDASTSGLYSVASGLLRNVPGLNVLFDSANSAYSLDSKTSTWIKDQTDNLVRDVKSGNASTAQKVVCATFYGIGWGANTVLDVAEAGINTASNVASNVASKIKGWFN